MSSSIAGELPALPGQSSDFAEPDSQGHIYSGVATAIIAMMIILVTTRQYTKYFIIRKLSWDDLTCKIAEILTTLYYINCQYQIFVGHVGTHTWNVPVSYIISEEWLIPAYLGAVLIPPAMIFIKLTFFLVYLQMFRPFAWLRICVYIGWAITTAFHLGVWIYLLVSITPRNGQNFMTVARSSAYSKTQRTSVTIAGVRVATDLYLLVLPIAAVVQLQLPTRRKIGVILIFLTGLAACIASAFSVYYRVVLNRNDEYDWNLMLVNICTYALQPVISPLKDIAGKSLEWQKWASAFVASACLLFRK